MINQDDLEFKPGTYVCRISDGREGKLYGDGPRFVYMPGGVESAGVRWVTSDFGPMVSLVPLSNLRYLTETEITVVLLKS